MTFPLSWPERLYGLVMMSYPRAFRRQYETDMRVLFRELLRDPEVGRLQLAGMMLRDLGNGAARPEHFPSRRQAAQSAAFGLSIVVFSIAAQLFHPGAYLGVSLVPVPFIAFIAAAFWGARRTRSFAGGMWVAVIIGVVASTMVLWDWLLFASFPFYDVYSFVLAMLMVAGFCLGPAIIGAIAGALTLSGAGSRHEETPKSLPAAGSGQ